MAKVLVFNHPLMSEKLSIIRNEKTNTKDFRQAVKEIATLMTYEATKDLETIEIKVKTPCGVANCKQIKKDIVIVPILRAGLGMVEGITDLIPNAKVGHIGAYRDEETLQPQSYYTKFPDNIKEATVLLVDPMLATGGSVTYSIDVLKQYELMPDVKRFLL